MAHFIQADGPLDRTYPNEYVHTIPLSWSNKITKQEVNKSYILNWLFSPLLGGTQWESYVIDIPGRMVYVVFLWKNNFSYVLSEL